MNDDVSFAGTVDKFKDFNGFSYTINIYIAGRIYDMVHAGSFNTEAEARNALDELLVEIDLIHNKLLNISRLVVNDGSISVVVSMDDLMKRFNMFYKANGPILGVVH